MATKKGDVIDFCKEAARRGKPVSVLNVSPVVQQVKHGNNNIQIAGNQNTANFHIKTTAAPKIAILPSPESIGGNPMLMKAIKERFNRLGETREKRFGKQAYQVLFSNFKKDFGIKNAPYTIIWDWPIECADTIIKYLDDKYSNTIQGKIENAAKRTGYIHSKGQLFKKEVELLGFLGLSTKSHDVRKMLHDFFGAESHTELTNLEHWQLVCYLEGQVKKLVDE